MLEQRCEQHRGYVFSTQGAHILMKMYYICKELKENINYKLSYNGCHLMFPVCGE